MSFSAELLSNLDFSHLDIQVNKNNSAIEFIHHCQNDISVRSEERKIGNKILKSLKSNGKNINSWIFLEEIYNDLVNEKKEIRNKTNEMISFVHQHSTAIVLKTFIIDISIKRKIIQIKISPNIKTQFLSGEDINRYPKIIAWLKEYFYKINQTLQAGRFYLEQGSDKIIYTVNFYAMIPENDKKLGFYHIYKYIELYNLHLKSIHDICTKPRINIDVVIDSGIKARPNKPKYGKIQHQLKKHEIIEEKAIIDKIRSSKNKILDKRFPTSQISFNDDYKVIYIKPIIGEEFRSELEENANEVIKTILNMIGDLANIKLYCKSCYFPLKSFV